MLITGGKRRGKFSTWLYSLGVDISSPFLSLYGDPLMAALLLQVSFNFALARGIVPRLIA